MNMNINNYKKLYLVLNKQLSNYFRVLSFKIEDVLVKITSIKPKTKSIELYILFDGVKEDSGYVWIFTDKNAALEQKNNTKLKLSKNIWYVNKDDYYKKLYLERYIIDWESK